MLLNNFTATLYNGMKITDTAGTIENGSVFGSAYVSSVESDLYSDTSGSYKAYAPFERGIVFGSGTTPPQKTDYKLENHITTGLTYSGNNLDKTNGVVHWVQTVQNTSTAQITITEVGLFTKDSSYPTQCSTYLLTRTVLDTPVVLQPDEVKTFTITLDYNKFVDGTIIQNS